MQRYGDLTVFRMAALCHLGFLKVNFLTVCSSKRPILHHRAKFRKDRDFCNFQDGGRRHLGFSKIRNFNGRSAVWGQCASPRQIPSKSDKRLQRYDNLTVFKMASAILDLLGAYWDHTQWPLGGLYHYAKFGLNRCSSFDNMKLSIFCPSGLKTPIHAPKIGVLGYFTPKMGSTINETPKRQPSEWEWDSFPIWSWTMSPTR